MIDPQTLRDAEQQLAQTDRKLARLISAHGPCTLGQKKRDPFHVLCGSIISQQLSVKAADTIQGRVADALGAGKRFVPGHFLAAEHEQLRACGLSNAKARWLRALAEAVDSGELSFKQLQKLDDEAAIKALDALPGIGRWTAEMFLIFAMDRLDIFSLGDVGLRNAMNRVHNGGEKLDDEATLQLAAAWAPYRSVGAWYLWRSSDGDVEAWA